jgi:hypothetical protein
VCALGLREPNRAHQPAPCGLGSWLRFPTEFRSHVGVAGLGIQGRIETCEATALVVLAARSRTAAGALQLALMAAAGFRQLSVEAGQLRPAADRALIDAELAGGGSPGRAAGEQAGQRAQLLPCAPRPELLFSRALVDGRRSSSLRDGWRTGDAEARRKSSDELSSLSARSAPGTSLSP